MLVMGPRLVDPCSMLLMRAEWLVMTLALILLSSLLTRKSSPSALNAPLGPAASLCEEPSALNESHSAQPNFPLELARLTPQEFSIFNFQFSSRVATCILLSFFLFYLIYIFLPVAGPQYYFRAVGIPEIMAGHFPSLGTYFSSHLEALAPPGWTDGLFYQLVAGAQEAGERPTAAFPSSHIGISTIVLILARRHAPRLLFLFLPLWALLCCATVYIRAHYLVDAIAGLISAPIILWLAEKSIGGGEKVVKDNVQR